MKFSSLLSMFLALTMFLSIGGCSGNNGAWEKIFSDSYDEIQYDNRAGIIWAVDFLDTKLYRLDPATVKREEILLPTDVRVSNICFSNTLWLAGFNMKTGVNMIMKYSENKFEEVLQSAVILGCKVSASGEILFWEKYKIFSVIARDEIQEIQGIREKTIIDVCRANDGQLWMLTQDGKIYINDNSEDWVLFADSQMARNIFVDDSYAWVANNGGIYRYQISSQGNKENLLEASLGFYQDIYQDQNGSIWIVTSENIWIGVDDVFSMVDLPYDTRLIKNNEFDFKNNILYISTNQGIFSLLAR